MCKDYQDLQSTLSPKFPDWTAEQYAASQSEERLPGWAVA